MRDWREDVRPRLAGLRLDPTREAEIVEELAQHLADRHAALVAVGATPEEADRLTRSEIADGGALSARLRPLRQARMAAPLPVARGSRWAPGALWLDLRHAGRSLRRDWPFTAAVVVALALCIGATTAVAVAVEALLFRPLGFDGSARVVNVWLSRPIRPNWHFRVPPADVRTIEAANHEFDGIGVYDTQPMNLTGDGPPEELATAVVSAGALQLFRVEAALGRVFTVDDEAPGHARIVLLSDGLWRRRFGARADAVGRDLVLDGVPHRIVGVLPRGFAYPARTEAWIPHDRGDSHGNAFLLARLRPGVDVARADAEMAVLVAAITNGRPNPGMRFTVEPLQASLTRSSRASWLLLLAAVVCVLGIGCVDVSILMLARGLQRRRDVDVRLALGATRAQIVRLLAAEGLWLAVAGGGGALLVAGGGIRGRRALAPRDTPRGAELAAKPTKVWIALATAALAACAFGLVPALRGSRGTVDATLKASGAPAALGRATSRLHGALIVLQLALALLLLTGTALIGRSLARLTAVDLGFDADRLLTVRLNATGGGDAGAARRMDAALRAVDEMRGLPGVVGATTATGPLLTGWGLPDATRTLAQRLTVEGAAVGDRPEEANMRRVEASYFRTLGIPVRNGRGFTAADGAQAPLVAVVNRAMARALWATDAPIGRRFAFEHDGPVLRWLEVVGVVEDTRDIAPTEAPAPTFFVPLLQHTRWMDGTPLHLYVRTSSDPVLLADAVRSLVWRIDPAQPVDVSTMAAAVDQFHRAPRFRTVVLGALAMLGLLLSVLGTHAVVAHAVGQRRAEIAVRLALGAGRGEIVRLVVGRALWLAGWGGVVGLVAAVIAARLARGLLFDVGPMDAVSLVAAAVVLLLLVVATAYPIARRAGGLDAARALRPDAV
jgi:predicted permease